MVLNNICIKKIVTGSDGVNTNLCTRKYSYPNYISSVRFFIDPQPVNTAFL